MEGIETAVSDMLARMQVMPPEAVKEWEWREKIAPGLQKLGFDSRYQKKLTLSAPQLAVRSQCGSLLVGCGAIVALVGVRGTGKTSIAADIAIERICYRQDYYAEADTAKRGKVPRALPWYFKASQLVARYKSLHADYGSIDGPALQESFEDLPKDCGLIVIDEWHECEDRKMRDRVLVDLIDRFYSHGSDVLIISNQEPREFATNTNASILSRLDEHGKIIPCKWESFRK